MADVRDGREAEMDIGGYPESVAGTAKLLEVAEATEVLLHLAGLGVGDVRRVV